eukprot:3339102-Pleurochrysis_carterae.AAC.1
MGGSNAAKKGGQRPRPLESKMKQAVGDDGVAGELRLLDDADDALELLLVEAELELALGHVHNHLAHLRVRRKHKTPGKGGVGERIEVMRIGNVRKNRLGRACARREGRIREQRWKQCVKDGQ